MTSMQTLPRSMRVATMYDPTDIRIEERPLPVLEAGDLLVATGASGVCSGDLMPWYVRRKAPFVFGHEPAGTVVAFGAGIDEAVNVLGRRIEIGSRVFAHHHAPCLFCHECRNARYVQCATWRSSALDPGGMAEYFRVPRVNLSDTLVLPDRLSFADGSLVEPLACVVKSLRRAFGIDPFAEGVEGRTVFVVGAGVMGLMHVAVAAMLGATVYVSDFNPARRAEARRLGAVAAFDPSEAAEALASATDGRLADAVICGPGAPAAIEAALDAVGPDGTLLMFTPVEPTERVIFDQSKAYFRDVRIVSSYSCGPDDTRRSLDLISRGVVTAERLDAVEYPFPGVAAAYDAMRENRIVKAIVTFPAVGRSGDGAASREEVLAG